MKLLQNYQNMMLATRLLEMLEAHSAAALVSQEDENEEEEEEGPEPLRIAFTGC